MNHLSSEQTFPLVLRFSHIRLYLCVALLTALNIAIPWFCHVIHPLAGPIFQPLFFFVLLGGLMFGWRAALLAGMLTPLVSYGLSGMPSPALLPGIIVQAAVYGFTAGLLRERYNTNALVSVVGAIAAGYIMAGAFLVIFSGSQTDTVNALWASATRGLPGILTQIVMLPLMLHWIEGVTNR